MSSFRTQSIFDSFNNAFEGIAFVEFTNADVVRHKLVQRIVEAYRRHAEATGGQRRR